MICAPIPHSLPNEERSVFHRNVLGEFSVALYYGSTSPPISYSCCFGLHFSFSGLSIANSSFENRPCLNPVLLNRHLPNRWILGHEVLSLTYPARPIFSRFPSPWDASISLALRCLYLAKNSKYLDPVHVGDELKARIVRIHFVFLQYRYYTISQGARVAVAARTKFPTCPRHKSRDQQIQTPQLGVVRKKKCLGAVNTQGRLDRISAKRRRRVHMDRAECARLLRLGRALLATFNRWRPADAYPGNAKRTPKRLPRPKYANLRTRYTGLTLTVRFLSFP